MNRTTCAPISVLFITLQQCKDWIRAISHQPLKNYQMFILLFKFKIRLEYTKYQTKCKKWYQNHFLLEKCNKIKFLPTVLLHIPQKFPIPISLRLSNFFLATKMWLDWSRITSDHSLFYASTIYCVSHWFQFMFGSFWLGRIAFARIGTFLSLEYNVEIMYQNFYLKSRGYQQSFWDLANKLK